MELSKVLYVCFFGDENENNERVIFPSANQKIRYLNKCFLDLGYAVDIFSCIMAKNGCKVKHKRVKSGKISVSYSRSNCTKQITKKISILINRIKLFLFILFNGYKYKRIVVYHSVYYLSIFRFLLPLFKNKIIIQIEDVYSELNQNQKISKKKEWQYLNKFKYSFCVNDLIAQKIKSTVRIVSYGDYDCRLIKNKNSNHNHMNLVYAGVIEQIRKGVFLAVNSMSYLPDNYYLTICGFGSSTDVDCLEKLIAQINQKLKRNAISFLGFKNNDELNVIFQNMDIALSTHSYSASDLSSADNTFPSKIIKYMSNGLPVVCQNLHVLSSCALSKYLYFYKDATPQSVADVILSCSKTDKIKIQNVVRNLDIEFHQSVGKILK